MIQFILTLTEVDGQVHVKSESPATEDCTVAEQQVALKLSEKIKFWIGSKQAEVVLPPEKSRIVLPPNN